MFIGDKVLKLRKTLGLSQKEFGDCLGISQKHVSQIEKDTREPSEQLIKHLCLRFYTSESWLKTGEEDMFISPEKALKSQIVRFGERAIWEAISNIMKEYGLTELVTPGLVVVRETQPAYFADPELNRMIETLRTIWATGDDRLKAWASVQFDRAFPADIVEEAQKKQKE